MEGEIKVEGIDELLRAMRALPANLRKKVLGRALKEAGKVIQTYAKQKAPVLQVPVPHRVKGLVRRSIVLRASKVARRRGDVGVYVTVPRTKKAALVARRQKGIAKRGYATYADLRDPYYFKFLERGTKHMEARPFLTPAKVTKANEAIARFMRAAIPEIEKMKAKR
jgi:HK97 gp10 family phage protein